MVGIATPLRNLVYAVAAKMNATDNTQNEVGHEPPERVRVSKPRMKAFKISSERHPEGRPQDAT